MRVAAPPARCPPPFVIGRAERRRRRPPQPAPPRRLRPPPCLRQFKYGQQSAATLKNLGAKLDFRVYNGMAHSACPPELAEVAAFIKRALASDSA